MKIAVLSGVSMDDDNLNLLRAATSLQFLKAAAYDLAISHSYTDMLCPQAIH